MPDLFAAARQRLRDEKAPKKLSYVPPPPALAEVPCAPPPIPGLLTAVQYVPDFISAEDEELVLQHVSLAPESRWSGSEADGRRTQNYGGVPGRTEVAEAFPEWVAPLVDAVVRSGAWSASEPPNHVLVNSFKPGAGLNPHTDGPLYHRCVAVLGLGSDVTLDLHAPHATAPHASLVLRRRSLNVISAEAYDQFHGIVAREADVVDELCANAHAAGAAVGERIERRARVSIVFVRKLTDAEADARDVPGVAR